jgi:hypothetical protein
MVKAYLKYVQQDVYGGLVGSASNIVICKVFNESDELVGVFVVSACNEVVNFSNIKTGEIQFKIYDKEALHGYVTHLSVSSDLLAIGYSSGTILVYNLKSDDDGELEKVH